MRMSMCHEDMYMIFYKELNLQLLLMKFSLKRFFSLTFFNYFPQVHKASLFQNFSHCINVSLTDSTSFSHTKWKTSTEKFCWEKNSYKIHAIALCNLHHIPALFIISMDFLTVSFDPSVNNFSEKLVHFYCSPDCICVTLVKFEPNVCL